MPMADLVSCILRNNHADHLSPLDKTLLEVKLLTHFYNELSSIFISRHQDYQNLIKSYQEQAMLSARFMQEMINDIVSTGEYSLAGIATYTHIPEEVLLDIVAGINTNPTLDFSRRLFELHASVRRDLYDQVMRKIASEYLVSA